MAHDREQLAEQHIHTHIAGDDADLGGTKNRPAGPDFGADDRTPHGVGTDFGGDALAGAVPLEPDPDLTDAELAHADPETIGGDRHGPRA